jgi:hypothetical protein
MSTNADNNYIPRDYQDLYCHYILGPFPGGSLCAKLIRHFLPYATPDEKETLLHDVFLRIMEKEMLKVFDPTKANFGGVIFFVTRTICTNHLNRKSRSPLGNLRGGSLVERDLEDGVFEPGVYSLDRIFGTEAPRNEEHLYAKRVLGELVSWTKTLYDTPRHKRDQSLFPLLNLLAEQRDPKECGVALGVTASTIANWMKVLKERAKEIEASYG